MLNWLKRQKSYTTAPAAAYPHPPLANWRNRGKSDITRNTTPVPEQVTRRNRKLGFLELFSLAVVLSLIVGVDLYILGINKRLSALESEFVEVKDWAFPASLLEGKYASLNARMRALTESFNGLDVKLATFASQQQALAIANAAAVDEAMMVTEADIPSESAQDEALTVTEVETASEPAQDGAMAFTEADIPSESAQDEAMAVTEVETAPESAQDYAMAVPEADIPSEAPAAGITRPSSGIEPESAAAAGRVRRADEETPAAAFTPAESEPVAMPGGSADDATQALHDVEKRPVEAAGAEPDLPVTPVPATGADSSQDGGMAGPWVINLLSDPSEALAERFAARARDHGVPVEQNRTEVKGRVYWRVQITGFDTAREAQTHADEVKEKLRLKDVWIFKHQG